MIPTLPMCCSAAVSPGDTQVPSGTTSYEEIGNINTSTSTDSTQIHSHEQVCLRVQAYVHVRVHFSLIALVSHTMSAHVPI